MWPFGKKDDKDKDEKEWIDNERETPSRFAYFFELPFYIKVFILIGIIFALNATLFLPLGLTAVLFEMWLAFIQAIRLLIPLWMGLFLMLLAALFGIYLIPRIEIPDTDEKYIYLGHENDGNLHYFKVLHGKLAFKDEYVKRVGLFRFTVIGEVSSAREDERTGITTYESEDLEVTQDLAVLAENKHLKRRISQMERDQRNSRISTTIDEMGDFVEKTKERR